MLNGIIRPCATCGEPATQRECDACRLRVQMAKDRLLAQLSGKVRVEKVQRGGQWGLAVEFDGTSEECDALRWLAAGQGLTAEELLQELAQDALAAGRK